MNDNGGKITKKRSLILKYFSKETYIDIIRIIKIPNADNNDKGVLIKNLLREKGIQFIPLGQGTNRMAVMIDGYAFKIALDDDGKIDNRKEFLYTKRFQPYVIRVYECIPDGLIAVSEYVKYFNVDDFHRYKEEMREILKDISQNYFIGDCGITGKNYINWGIRNDGTICILDFAYIYDVKSSIFSCSCDESGPYLQYDSNFVNLSCPVCGRKYTFQDLRRRITKAEQEKEIGDVRRLSYNLKSSEETLDYNSKFEPSKKKKKKDKELSEVELLIKRHEKEEKKQNLSVDD